MKQLNELALIMMNLTKLTRTQVCVAAKLSPQNASHWLNGRVDSFSIEKQSQFLKVLGMEVSKGISRQVSLDRGRLHNWILDENISEIKEMLDLSISRPSMMEKIRIYRYGGTPSREAVLMVPVDENGNKIWIRLTVSKSASQPATIDSSTLGFGLNVNLSAQDWFEGVNGGENDFGFLRTYFDRDEAGLPIYGPSGDDAAARFGIKLWEVEHEIPEQREWLELLDQILHRGYEFENVVRKVRVIFDL